MKTETRALLSLSLVPGLSRKRLASATKRMGGAQRILQSSKAELVRFGFSPASAAAVVDGSAAAEARRLEADARREGATILSAAEALFPARLKTIFDPPLILHCVGNLSLLNRPGVAIVGSRRCSVYGREVARKLARDLAETGLTVVSGLARGVDTMVHRSALEGHGHTVAVLGNGLDVVYPRENGALYEAIRGKGCLISEYPLGVHPAARNFPERNRIMSGLCLGTLVVEAAEASGSLITARLALEQNREVWAVPGNITSPSSDGPNSLIRQGAAAVTCAQDVLDELPPQTLYRLSQEMGTATGPVPSHGKKLSQREKDVVEAIPLDRALHIDCMVEETKMKLVELNPILLALEIKGYVLRLPGQRFSRVLQ